jgi:hypothetical protein
MIGPLVAGFTLIGVVGYLFLSDTMGHIKRWAERTDDTAILKRADVRAVLRLQFCSLILFLVIPLAGLMNAFARPWYWAAAPAVLIGFYAGRFWELLKTALSERVPR